MKEYFFEKAWLTSGHKGKWHENTLITVDDGGFIASVKTSLSETKLTKITGLALPAFANSHSHAFQRLLTGHTEYKTEYSHCRRDNFWSWRDLMYQVANRVTPEDLKNIAAFVYLEMVKAGYGAVAEFHYLHHQPSGQAYDNGAEMSLAIIEAARSVGIALTLLPVLYQRGGFDGRPLERNQYRFGMDTDSYLRLVEKLKNHSSCPRTGVAFHSLRAVSPEAIEQVMAEITPDMPVHIHIAEQLQEVEDCLKFTGQRPVEWLLSRQNTDPRWCLVHGTHMTEPETSALADSGAVVSLCPSTEANLGDGFFPFGRFLGAGGTISIGSDSNSLIDPIEEARWLEYGARLREGRRNIAANEAEAHSGTALFSALCKGGAQALGQKTGAISEGYRADIMVIDDKASSLWGIAEDNILDALIFSGNHHNIKHVMVAGKWSVRDRHHNQEQDIRENYHKTLQRLMGM